MAMMRFYLLAALCILFLPASGCGRKDRVEGVSNFEYINTRFADPPAEYRPAPFWVWHEVAAKEKIREQLADFKEKGIGGVFVHPRYGMVTEYLSDEWFDLFAYTLQTAEELGLLVWIYDENSFPSGFAGGLVPEAMPDSWIHGQGLVLVEQNIFDPCPDRRYLHYMKKEDSGEYQIIKDIESERGKEGSYTLFELINYPQSKWYAGYSYVDLIYPGVTEKFLEMTMSGYEKFSEHFGGLIAGVFTDEPNIAPTGGGNTIRWTPDLYECFRERWGYSLEDNLMALYNETGDWKRLRHNYYQLLLQLFIDRWSKPWFEYTEKQNLAWTGHYWEHGWPGPHHGGDNMAMYAWHQMPGIDLLFNTMDQEDYPVQFGNPRLVREVKSAASQMGRRRTLSETYGAAGWELTFEDQKRLGDWAYVLGVNYLNPHLAFMTLLGDRKHDFPQSFSYHAPYWRHYRMITDYFARLSLVLSHAEQYNDILIIEPTSTAWMYYSPQNPNDHLELIRKNFQDFLDRLEAWQIEYDLGSENIIKDHGFTGKGQFGINQRQYRLVVLPGETENLDKTTFHLLSEYLKHGGRIISLGRYPVYIDGVEDELIANIISRYPEQWLLADDFTDKNVYDYFICDEIIFEIPDKKPRELFHYRGRLSDGQILFLVNTGMEGHAQGSFTINGNAALMLDAESGKITGYPAVIEGGKLTADFDLPPAGSLLLFITEDSGMANPPDLFSQTEFEEIFSPLISISPIAENVLVLDYCCLTLPEQEQTSLMYYYTAGDLIWQHHGFDDNPWVSSVQFRTELADRDTFSFGTGYKMDYPFHIAQGVNKKSIRAVAERPELFTVSINGSEVPPAEGEWYLEQDYGVYEIGRHLKTGENLLSVEVRPMSIFAEPAAVMLTGGFSLRSQKAGWRIEPEQQLNFGPWKEQGLPFYADGVKYSRRIEIEERPARAIVRFDHWKGTVAEVRVNGVQAGAAGWRPYEADITEFLQAGENAVDVVIYGSLKNTLGPHHFVRRRGIVTPWSFKYAPEILPGGDSYDLLDYGLIKDFKILMVKK